MVTVSHYYYYYYYYIIFIIVIWIFFSNRFEEAETLVKLYCLCLPNSSFISSSPDTGLQLIQVGLQI